MDTTGQRRRFTRRRVLGLCAGSVALAGCLGGSEDDSAPTETTDGGADSDGGTDELLPPPVAGNPEADVTLEVYSDYACGHCATFNQDGLPQIEDDYIADGTIRYEHRDLPLPVTDPGSWVAASAAREVQARDGADAFYEFSEALFANSAELRSNPGDLCASLADQQGLDGEAIRTAGVDLIHEETLRRDRQRGIDFGVEGTPTFIVNGEIVAAGFGSSTLDEISTTIDQRL